MVKRVAAYVELRDFVALVGTALTFIGLWLIFPPAALVVAGFTLTALAVWPLTRHPQREG